MAPSTCKRVSAHSHVRGLGLDENGQAPEGCKAGLVGQAEAREAAGIIIDLVRMKKLAGRAVMFAGKPGTGKTAIALAMSQELGTKVPFCPMVASEVYSSEVKKTEILMENFRKAIGVRVRETKEVYEGEVVEFTPVETENPIGSVGKTIGSLIVKLKATKGTKTLNLDPAMYDNFQREKIEVGDVIYIEVKSGAIVRQGRCDVYAAEYDLEAEEYVPLPKGDVRKTRQVVQDFTLHDIDAANANAQGGQDVLSKIRELVAKGKTEITDKLRTEVDKIVDNFIDEGIAELVPGVLFIDEVHMLDVECFVFLHKVLESKISPIVIFSTNRGMVPVRGNEEMIAAHGIPADLLDRLLIIKTVPFTKNEQKEILKLKAEVEEVALDENCLDYLADLGHRKTLRYAIQLLNPAKQLSQIAGSSITKEIISEASQLFIDIQRSSEILAESAKNSESKEGGDKFMK